MSLDTAIVGRVALVMGPEWTTRGLDQRAGRYPLAVEAPVMRTVDVLAPGVSTVTRFMRYYAFYAALAQRAGRDGLDHEACRRLVRRSEVVLAAVHRDQPQDHVSGRAHGIERVRGYCDGQLKTAQAASIENLAKSYSPRLWGFWAQYGGPCATLGITAVENGAIRPGRHACPQAVIDLFGPLFDAAERDTLDFGELDALGEVSLSSPRRPEVPWLTDLFTATRGGMHEPPAWQADDRIRRATLRVLARAVDLHRDAPSFEEAMIGAVAFCRRR